MGLSEPRGISTVDGQLPDVNRPPSTVYRIFYRLIALWVVCEAMLGGIIHGLKLPVSGLIVGSSAVICICQIAYYNPKRGSILKATIIVAIFKMMLSPQSPFPAYIAVFFQGLVAELIFMNRKSFRLKCILFAAIALFESGIQRVLVMTIIYGTDIWKAIDLFINGITGEKIVTNYSYFLIIGYILLHLIVGIAVGWFAGKIPLGAENYFKGGGYKIELDKNQSGILPSASKKNRKWLFIFLWLTLVILFMQSKISPANSILPSGLISKLLIRSALIVLTWITIINPVLNFYLKRWLEKKKSVFREELNEISLLIPSTKNLIQQSWNLSSTNNFLKRLVLFSKIVMYNSLKNEQ